MEFHWSNISLNSKGFLGFDGFWSNLKISKSPKKNREDSPGKKKLSFALIPAILS